jgi:Tol biopolymer transport system component
VSLRSYEATLSSIYRGTFAEGTVSGVELVPGVSRKEPRMVNFDVDVSPDGGSLYFVDARFGRSGPETADLVVAERRGTEFVRAPDSAELLQNVNTEALEYAPCISADGLTLLFTRARLGLGGSVSIFVSHRTRTTEPFGPGARLTALDGFVEAPTLSPDERSIYFHKRDGTKFVIYRASK